MADAGSLTRRRIATDMEKLIELDYEITRLDVYKFLIRFYGPLDTPYEGGIWLIHVNLPENYPYGPPTVKFLNTIFHPNICDDTGAIWIDKLSEKWRSDFTLAIIFNYFLPQLLADPNPHDYYNARASQMYLEDPHLYKKEVADYVSRFATYEIVEAFEIIFQEEPTQ